jgi:glycosyltransferase involved in cell wall biosynthesis
MPQETLLDTQRGSGAGRFHADPGPAAGREIAGPRFRFHLLGLAHLPTHRDISTCAYTQKIIKLARMLKNLGHSVIFYGGEGSDVQCDEFVQVISAAERRACYGDYDWTREFFRHDGRDAAHQAFNAHAISAIRARQRPGDFLLCTMGNYQQPIAQALQNLWVVEPGIGYEGVFSGFRAFESYAWMHYLYGMMRQTNGSWYDAVIPNYFDPADFPYQPEKGDYALFIGRLVQRKGVDVAVQVTRHLNIPLVIAGQGSLTNPGEGLDIHEKHVEFVGSVGPARRAELMGKARMVFTPTYYIEPFGGVAVEAQMCGTPVLSTDWGAFSETVQHGVTGYRCRTFDDFVWSAENIQRIRPADCRAWATENYSMARVQAMFQEFFSKIADIACQGWYEPHPERSELDWLRKQYPPGESAAVGARLPAFMEEPINERKTA